MKTIKKWRVTFRATQSNGSGELHKIVVDAEDVLAATLAAGTQLKEMCPNAYIRNIDFQDVKALVV